MGDFDCCLPDTKTVNNVHQTDTTRTNADRIGIEVERDAALAELRKLRRTLAEIADLTRYTSNARWALRRMTLILAREAEHDR